MSNTVTTLIILLLTTLISTQNFGINLPSNVYYNNAPMYYDVFMQTSGNNGPWDTAGNGVSDGLSNTDSTGAPIPTPISGGTNTTQAWCGFTSEYSAGNYTLTWSGTGTITFDVGTLYPATKTIVNGVQQNTAIYYYPGPSDVLPTDNNWIYVLATFPVSNIHLLSPSEFYVPGSVFRSDFLATLRPFSTFRFMDALNTNGNNVGNWSQRTSVNGSRGSTPQGIAYEDIVDLAVNTGKAVWINVPCHATDDYVCRLARFFALGELGPSANPNAPCSLTAPATGPFTTTVLTSSHTIYLEYSNEIWNYGFQQVTDIGCMANAGNFNGASCKFSSPTSAIVTALLANTSLPWTTTAENQYARAQELTFMLAKRVVDIFKAVFALASSPPKLKPILNVQAAYTGCYYFAWIFYQQAYPGAFNQTFPYMAIAPYANIDSDSNATSIDNIFTDLYENIVNFNSTDSNNVIGWMKSDYAFSLTMNTTLIAYEGGQGISGNTNVDNKVNAQVDPRMYTFTQYYLNAWVQIAGSNALFNYYSLVGGYSQFGSWGALTSLALLGSHKYDAMIAMLSIPGDANLDGVVNGADCLVLAQYYNATGVPNSNTFLWYWWRNGDFNHDGVVNGTDLNILNQNAPYPNLCILNGQGVPIVNTATSNANTGGTGGSGTGGSGTGGSGTGGSGTGGSGTGGSGTGGSGTGGSGTGGSGTGGSGTGGSGTGGSGTGGSGTGGSGTGGSAGSGSSSSGSKSIEKSNSSDAVRLVNLVVGIAIVSVLF